MASHSRKNVKQISEIAARYDLYFDGCTQRGHFRWLHRPSGFVITSISSLGNWRDIKNVERTFKYRLRQIAQTQQTRVSNGHQN